MRQFRLMATSLFRSCRSQICSKTLAATSTVTSTRNAAIDNAAIDMVCVGAGASNPARALGGGLWLFTALVINLLAGAMPARAQSAVSVTVLQHDNSWSTGPRAPSINFAFGRAVYLLKASELAAAGVTGSRPVTGLGWIYDIGSGLAGSAPMKMYLQNTNDTTNQKSTTWSTSIGGMTLVHDATTAFPGTVGTVEIAFTGGSSFNYTGGGLYVAWDWGQYTGPAPTTNHRHLSNSGGLSSGLLGAQGSTSAPATLGSSSFRPLTRLTVLNNAAVATGGTLTAITGQATAGSLSASDADSDPLTYAKVGDPAQGTVTVNSDGSYSYQSTSGYLGPDSFTFKANDGLADSNTATINITVVEVPSLVVTTASDASTNTDGQTSLREAITFANSDPDASIITFDAGVTGTIQLGSALPDLLTDMTITGPSATLLTVRGEGSADQYRIFTINSGVTATISGLTASNGRAADGIVISGIGQPGSPGGGIYNAGTLTLTGVTISGNSTGPGGTGAGPGFNGNGGAGGGIVNQGTLTINDSTISGNATGNGGGGGLNPGGQGGGIYNLGTLTVNNSTISGNTTGNSTGGGGLSNGNMATLESCTITNNTANTGGGVLANGTTNVRNTIIAGNNGFNGPDVFNAFTSQGFNLIGQTDGSSGFGTPGDQFGSTATPLDPKIGALGYNGGTTLVHALLPGSPAIHTGDTSLATDQRGIARPQGGTDDIGAYEARQGFSISGLARTSSLAPISGVAVTLLTSPGGATVDTTTTNGSGAYSFGNVAEGYYTLTASKTGYTFTPASQGVRVSSADRAVNFIGAAIGVSVSGRLMHSDGSAIAGATVTADTGQTATTNSAGYYTLLGVPDGSRTLTPSKATYNFSPPTKNVTVSGANLTGQNFIGSIGYTVSGRIATSSGAAIPGVTVTLDGGATAISNSAGYFTFYNVANGSHTLVPSKPSMTFTPPDKTANVNNANLSGRNFTGTGP